MFTRTNRLGVLSLVGASLALLAASASAQQPAIKIGLVGPFSGGSADFGTSMKRGAELAIKEINDLGGYVGRKFEVVVKDDKSTPDGALAAAQELIKEGVVATIGFCNTGNAMKALDEFQKNKVPLLVPCATGSPITKKYPTAESYIFQSSATDNLQVPFVVNDAVKRGWTKIAIFADTTGYGEAGFNDFMAALEAHKLKPAYIKRFDVGVKDLSDAVKEARDAGAQTVFTITVGPENALIGRAREALGWKVTQIGTWPLSFPFYIDNAKSAAEGSLMAQTFIAEPSNERRSTFLANFRRAYKVERITVPVAAAQGYDAGYLLAYALFTIKNKTIDGPAIKHALETNDRPYYGVVTTYKNAFSTTDYNAITMNMLYLGVVRNGAITFAYPEDARRNLAVQRKG